MGNYLGTTKSVFYVYNRDNTDAWVEKPMITSDKDDLQWICGRFKHTFFELAQAKVFDFNKIYLYENRSRLTRCELSNDKQTITVIHSTSAASDAWESCKRSKLGIKFDKDFKIVKKTTYEIEYEKIRYSEKLTTPFEIPV
jgi:hypothetical protein|tara:strand:- start:25 stop:447 length:423 start_codon:yes stop_codon:yes gene_type:complete